MAQWILVRPTALDEQDAAAFVREYAAGDRLPVQGGSGLGEKPFAEWLAQIAQYEKGEALPRGHVPSSCFFLKNSGSPRIYGVVSVRWQLTPPLMRFSGNIGYSIRPSMRGMGFGKAQLQAALRNIGERGVDSALLTCDEDNAASAATILSCGGREIAPYIAPAGKNQRRFLIDLPAPGEFE